MWQDKYLSNLNGIIDLISKGDVSSAKISLATYLTELRDIGNYNKDVWRIKWRSRMYDFGKLFTDDASWVLLLIEQEMDSRGEYEALNFIHSEIIWNYFDNKNDYVKDQIKELIKKYPTNPEFHHAYSHILECNGSFEIAVSEAKHCLSQEKGNYIFLYTYVEKVKKYFDNLLNKENLEDATRLLEKEEEYYKTITPFQKDFVVRINNDTMFSSLKDRLKDHVTIASRIKHFSQEMERKINIEQKRLIEVLGLFSAILGFILTNIAIGISNLNLKDMMVLMISMATTLVIFAIAISYLFGRGDRSMKFWVFLEHRKFWALVILFAILISIFLFSFK